MQDIEPYWKWRDFYTAEEDEKSPFFGREYSEFQYTEKIYNYYIHPQWDFFGSETLYLKLIYCDYKKNTAVIEFIGEWNDCIANDILEFFGAGNDYYEEWYEDIKDDGGYIIAINLREHIMEEMYQSNIHQYININKTYNDINWRKYKPFHFINYIDDLLIKLFA